MKNTFKYICLILGSIIGAGFASGQEIYIFFVQNGLLGLVALVLSILLIVLFIVKVLTLNPKGNEDYTVFLNKIFKNNNVLVTIIKTVATIFLLISFIIMGIAFISLLEEFFQASRVVSAIIVSIIAFLVLKGNINGVTRANEYIMPGLIIILLIIGMYSLFGENIDILNIANFKKSSSFFLSALLYASYNVIVLVPILLKISTNIESRKQIRGIALVIFVVLFICGIAVYIGSSISGNYAEFPMMETATTIGTVWSWVYFFVILGAIFTSQICSGYSLLSSVTKTQKQYNVLLLFISLLLIFLCNFSFSQVVKVCYPVFGALGFVQFFCIVLEKSYYY